MSNTPPVFSPQTSVPEYISFNRDLRKVSGSLRSCDVCVGLPLTVSERVLQVVSVVSGCVGCVRLCRQGCALSTDTNTNSWSTL